jgi:mercuric ion binding protein
LKKEVLVKPYLAAALGFGLLAAPMAAQAGQATVVLDVHHAGCVLCGPIIKSALEQVKGVSAVKVSQANGNADVFATVTYDNALATPAALIKATTVHGYPAELAKKTGSS